MKKIYVALVLGLLLASCGWNTQVIENPVTLEENPQLQVTSSIIPLSSLINSVGWEYVSVNTIVPAGVSPHGFDLSARQMVEVEKSDIIFLVGLEEIDGFLKKSAPAEKQVHLADGIELLKAEAHSHEEEHAHEEDEHKEEEKTVGNEDIRSDEHMYDDEEHAHDSDPHVWLGKENITLIAQKIRDELSALLPEQGAYFSQNTEAFIVEMEQIYAEFETQVAGKSPREFIVFHDAYNYLMQSIRMDLWLRIPFSKNVLHETGTAHRVELIEEIELHGVRHVFREPQFSDGNLQSFADEYNLTIGILDPLGNDASASGYLQNLRNNLESLSLVYE